MTASSRVRCKGGCIAKLTTGCWVLNTSRCAKGQRARGISETVVFVFVEGRGSCAGCLTASAPQQRSYVVRRPRLSPHVSRGLFRPCAYAYSASRKHVVSTAGWRRALLNQLYLTVGLLSSSQLGWAWRKSSANQVANPARNTLDLQTRPLCLTHFVAWYMRRMNCIAAW